MRARPSTCPPLGIALGPSPTIRREGIQDGITIYQFPPLCVDVVVLKIIVSGYYDLRYTLKDWILV